MAVPPAAAVIGGPALTPAPTSAEGRLEEFANLPMPPGAMPSVGQIKELADPEIITKQKDSYARDLEEQLRMGTQVLGDAHKVQTEQLHAQAAQEKTRYNLVMDQQVKQQELHLSQEYNEQLMRLQQTAQAKRAELEQQATGLTLEFQQRKVQEEFMAQQLGIQQQHSEAQKRIEDEMRKIGLEPGAQLTDAFGLAVPQLPGFTPTPSHVSLGTVNLGASFGTGSAMPGPVSSSASASALFSGQSASIAAAPGPVPVGMQQPMAVPGMGPIRSMPATPTRASRISMVPMNHQQLPTVIRG